MRRFISFATLLSLVCTAAMAVPAKPGVSTVKQSDGTTLQVQALGDEFNHSVVTTDHLTIARGSDGDFYYMSAKGLTSVRAHNAASRSAAEKAFLQAHEGEFTMDALRDAKQASGMLRARRAAPPKRATQVPTIGAPRVPIILVQYKDKKMSNTKAQFESHYKTAAKSAYQYFVDQSNSKYTPQFDIYGIYTLDNNRAVYGGNSGGLDKGVARMVAEGIEKAGTNIDWSLYDNDGNDTVDVCIVVYAGVGEAQATYTVPSSVWPCQWSLSDAQSYGDGNGAVTRDNVTIDKFAVFNEVGGSSDSGRTLDGIGTFCHEFSHCLGLPDFYETTYRNGYFGMSYWSLMNSGCYNGISVDGDTPIGYSAYEKNFMSWIDLIEPVENTQYTLPVFNSKSLENDQAIKITSHLNENEFFILENRRQQGWDYCIDDEGVLITHFTYIPARWDANTVNDQAIQLATIIPADGLLSDSNLDKDLYGETNHAFSSTSTPASKLNMRANGTLASSSGGAGTLNKAVTEIYLNSDGTASLWYMKGVMAKETPQLTDTTDITSNSFTAHWNAVPNTLSYTLEVKDLNVQPEYQLLMTETFSKFTSNTYETSSSLDTYMDNAGWTGSKLYRENGGLRIGSSTANGELVSPALDLGEQSMVTVLLDSKNYSSDANVGFTVSYGNETKSFTSTGAATRAIVFENAVSGGKVTIATTTKGKRIVVTGLKIYAGDASDAAQQAPRRATETGNANRRIITGITSTSYTVTGLNENSRYSVRVRPFYTDETDGNWSNIWEVQLHSASTILPGDVNGDGRVDVQDVSATIAYILNQDLETFITAAADVNGDGNIDVQDVSAIINIILDNDD